MSYERIVIDRHGGPEVLRLAQESTLPAPGPGQARIKVLAAGTGFTDTLVRRGLYPGIKERLPFSPGYDIVGEIDALGPDRDGLSTGLRIGQRVADMPVWGGYTQYLIRPLSTLVSIPQDIDPAEAVCLPLAFMTAYQMLTRYRRFQSGDRIFIQGASGTVGTALLALGQHFGLRMWGTASEPKFGILEHYGCTPIDYRRERFVERLRREADEGVDAVFDAMAGQGWRDGFACLRENGILLGYGAQANVGPGTSTAAMTVSTMSDMAYLLGRCNLPGPLKRRGVFYHIGLRRNRKPHEYSEDLTTLATLVRQGRIRPQVADRLPLTAAAEAHRRIDAGQVTGKIVLLPWS